jgi:predicted ester cyclase
MSQYSQLTSVEETKEVVEQYLHGHDISKVADDAVFVIMANGQESKGRLAIEQLVDYFYNKAFTARFDRKDLVVGEGKAVVEGDFTGKQNLEFAGIQPSGREVHVPLCIKYDVKNGKIARANIYFETDTLRMQR